jgi:tRNA (guanine-N7-)-methyltransferase
MTDDSQHRHHRHGPGELRSFGRRTGRAQSHRQQILLSELLPKVAIDLAQPYAAADAGTWLEIGFGGGEHLLWHARRNPTVRIIGCEPFEDGVVKVLRAIDEEGLGNIRLHADDARPLLRWLPQASISRAFVLFPDPWPKKKQQKRRLINPAFLAELARVMRPDAELRIGTDIADYARSIMIAVQGEPRFAWQAEGPDDWRIRPGDWPETRYEQKAKREGRTSSYLRFRRVEN